jgi:hypothetical protein
MLRIVKAKIANEKDSFVEQIFVVVVFIVILFANAKDMSQPQ